MKSREFWSQHLHERQVGSCASLSCCYRGELRQDDWRGLLAINLPGEGWPQVKEEEDTWCPLTSADHTHTTVYIHAHLYTDVHIHYAQRNKNSLKMDRKKSGPKPVIPALLGEEAGGLGVQDHSQLHCEFRANLGSVRPSLKKQKKLDWETTS